MNVDEAQALAWFQKAADQGIAGAQFNLGFMYADGRGVAKDERKAVELFQKAAAQQDAGALLFLGNMYRDRRGVVRDESNENTAVECYRQGLQPQNPNQSACLRRR